MYLLTRIIVILALVGSVAFWLFTRPVRVDEAQFASLSADALRGEAVFWAAGCASCHAAPGAAEDARTILSGGTGFTTDFGTFYAPNISPGPAGISGWSVTDLANAMSAGVSPEGQHYYPAFPYTSYVKARPQDVADLHAFLQTLPASDVGSKPHEVGLPFSIRRLMGGWKRLFFTPDYVLSGNLNDQVTRGRYLVEALGHCGECHTARNLIGGLKRDKWLGGAPNPSGKGRIPNITRGGLDWSEGDIAEYLKSGFTPEYDVAGGEMAEVVQNTAHLSDADRAAIAAYLKAVPAVK
ncbi:cytochrome c [Pseudooceanicola sp.]|uniref:cytochrome c n=1 Tax=Pseudooceanicola sp. TaxID=1914328 RepID=UPI00262B7054|nr:cytochrome c [Pseudooceanicola sp.]MDF1854166.1 cytochrome c [Pseudooceanicola sp.]